MKGTKLSPWIVIDGYCATRVIEGTDSEVVANRVAFIEKTPRVRIAPFTNFDEEQGKWPQGPKGGGGSGDHEALGQYGFDPESRAWCDKELKKLGYILEDDKDMFNLVKLYGDTICIHHVNADYQPKNYKKIDGWYEVKIDTEAEPKAGDIVCGYLYGDLKVFIYKKGDKPHIGQLYNGYNWENYKII